MTAATPGGRQLEAAGATMHRGRRPADTFANRLLLTIRLVGLPIREFAEAADLDDGSVSNWTRGMTPRDKVAVCEAIALAHDIDEEWLLKGGPLLPVEGRPTKRLNRPTVAWVRRDVWATTHWPFGRNGRHDIGPAPRRNRIVQRPTSAAA